MWKSTRNISSSRKTKQGKTNKLWRRHNSILDDIQDPGNLGTILRTVDSVGLSQIIVSKKSGDVYNSKVVRSTMGAIFRVNVIESENLKDTIKEIKKHKFNVISTSLDTDKSLYDIN